MKIKTIHMDVHAATERAIVLLKARRAGPIAAAVTGQIDLSLKPKCEVRSACE